MRGWCIGGTADTPVCKRRFNSYLSAINMKEVKKKELKGKTLSQYDKTEADLIELDEIASQILISLKQKKLTPVEIYGLLEVVKLQVNQEVINRERIESIKRFGGLK